MYLIVMFKTDHAQYPHLPFYVHTYLVYIRTSRTTLSMITRRAFFNKLKVIDTTSCKSS